MELPVTSTTAANGTTEYAISGEYGSSSEGTLELSADGHSLVIAGYGVNPTTYNTGGAASYGNAAEAQSTSVPGGKYTAVPRVIADISSNGTVDTSTALYNVDNTNNPRSAATVNGSTYYLAGQGKSGDTTQGLQVASDGAPGNAATIVNDSTDMRTAEIYNGNLYVSTDSKQGTAGFTANIAEYNGLPTGSATPTILPGISQSVTLNGSNGNAVNGSSGTANLSPENFFFANATTLYVADGGIPKGTGLGDGGLQKWTLANGAWNLDYTLSAGLNLQPNTINDPGSGGAGTTGLIGLTGQSNPDGTVSLYATNATKGDLNQTYLYGITDNLAATSASAVTGESFTALFTAPADSNVRGVAFAPTCYCPGTLIRTVRGDVAVEHLAIGNLVVTASGAHRPIRWIGHRAFAGRFVATNPDMLPICFRAGALAGGVPARDLWVSPKHAMYLDGALIPAECLVNGVSVVKAKCVDSLEYWHVELDSHDVLLAEGAPAESFVDDNSRAMFHNARSYNELYPDARVVEAVYCAPRLEDGYQLEAIRRTIAARAGLAMAALDCGELHGFVDAVEEGVVKGWACSALRPALSVCLDLVVDGRVVATTLANRPRADLDAIGYGPHAFELAVPVGVKGGSIAIRRSADGADLPWSMPRAA